MVVVPGFRSVAVALPVLPEMVAMAGFEELHFAVSTTLPLIVAVNVNVEFFNCFGLAGDMASFVAARAIAGTNMTISKNRHERLSRSIPPPQPRLMRGKHLCGVQAARVLRISAWYLYECSLLRAVLLGRQ